jgi:hypothetical protein
MTATHPREAVDRDDRVLRETRWAGWAIVAILIPAVVVLWGLPAETADLWAWTIKPEMTAIFMGSGYAAGAFFFTRVALGPTWHPASAGVLASATFAGLMLIPTLAHWDRFNHGDGAFLAAFAFYGWVIVYIAAPVLVAALWLANRRTDPRTPAAGDRVVPALVRRIALVLAAVALGAAALFLVSPSTAIDVWPWMLTPLTARVLACFTAQVGLGALLLSLDSRWSSWRLLLETCLVATAFLLVGTARRWGDFDAGSSGTWIFLGALIGLALAILALFRSMRGDDAAVT